VSVTDISEARRGTASVPVQILRGIGWTVLLLLAIAIAAWLFWTREHPQWVTIGVLGGLAAGCWLVRRHLRRWATRPRWFLPVGAVVLAVALVPALKPFTIDPEAVPVSCTPLFDAWHPVVPRPSQSDLETWRSVYSAAPLGINPLRDPAARQALFAQMARTKATAAFRRADKWVVWTFGSGTCVARSRHDVLVSGALLGAGAIGITTALVVRRRRAVRLT
jgi:hypothetical protein